jgi:hypothetical protein
MTNEQREEVIRRLKNNEELSPEWRWSLFLRLATKFGPVMAV